MNLREYDAGQHYEGLAQVWHEVGWIRAPDDAYLRDFLSVGSTLVALLNGQPEAMAQVIPGQMRYQDQELPLAGISAVCTSRVARKQGFARQLTARQLARAAAEGAAVAALGMFDQGFYDRVGFGTGSYQHCCSFDPATLLVTGRFRPPARLGREHWQHMHEAMVRRWRGHGGVVLTHAQQLRAELGWTDPAFGLGYYEAGRLTHFFWAENGGEYGPLHIKYLAYENAEQLFELLALLKSLGDQVGTVKLAEPPGVQLQTLLAEPLRQRRRNGQGEQGDQQFSGSVWQLRLLDVARCVAGRRWRGPPLTFGLRLTDPVADQLDGAPWQGVAGTYRIEIRNPSRAEAGAIGTLPELRASVNSFSRLWFGVAPATHLALVGELQGPAELLEALDEALALPQPQLGWEF